MRKRSSNVAFGAVILAGIGYVAGLLTAPQSGKETRKDIQKNAMKAKSEVEQTLKKLHGELDSLIAEGSEKTQTLSAKAKAELDEVIANAQEAKQKARELLSALHEGDSQDKDLKKAVDEVSKSIDHLKKFLKKDS